MSEEHGQLEFTESVPAVPARPADGHKGTFGTVIVVGGSATMIGAPALCAAAALRSGVGLAKIATRAEVLPFAITIEPSATGVVIGDNAHASAAAIEASDTGGRAVLAVGPGLGQGEAASALVAQLLASGRAVVLDADGLNILARFGRSSRPAGAAFVLTPHPGEYTRLAQPMGIGRSAIDPAERPEAAAVLARAHRAVVVLKGAGTVVSDGYRVFLNPTGNSALATAGTGDVLTGVIAALLAQGLGAFDAASLGVYLHGMAADLWAGQRVASGLTALELTRWLPDAFAVARGT